MSSAITYGVLVLITIVCLFPIVWMCLISIKDTSESITGFNSILVTHPTLGNFKRLFEMIPVGQNTFNSVFTTIMGTVTSLFFCALAGFAFAKYKFKGKEFFFMIVLSTLMIPGKDSFILFCNCYHAGTAGSWFCTTVHHHEKSGTDQQPLVFSYPKNCNSSWYLLHEPVYHRCSG